MLVLVGCASPEQRLERGLENAQTLQQEGDLDRARAVLDELNLDFPNTPEVLLALANIATLQDDALAAGLFFEAAALASGEDGAGFHLLAADNLAFGGDLEGAIRNYDAYLSAFPEDAASWFQLGRLHEEANALRPAINAFLNGIARSEQTVSPRIEFSLGRLYLQIGNSAQARRFLESSANRSGPHAEDANIELLRLKLQSRQWAVAEGLIARIDQDFPGALEDAGLDLYRQQIADWRANQAALANIRLDLRDSEEEVPERDLEGVDAREEVIPSPTDPTVIASAIEERLAPDLADSAELVAGEESHGPAVVKPLPQETADFFATLPIADAEELLEDESEETDSEQQDIVLDDRPATGLVTLADAYLQAGDFEQVIEMLWPELTSMGNDPRIWYRLSLAFYALEEFREAEMMALEAVRREPNNLAFRMNYLRTAQRVMTPARFLSELERTYDDFPESPEVVLALATAYERIAQSQRTADLMFRHFLEIAPDHPRAESIRERLRNR